MRFASLYFVHLLTDWQVVKQPDLKNIPFVFSISDHGRLMVKAASPAAQEQGIAAGMNLADAKAIVPDLEIFDHRPGRENALLKGIGEWCIRYTPWVALNGPDGLFLDTTGCSHLWGSEQGYLTEIITRLQSMGYHIRAAIADTLGTAWAIARFGESSFIIEPGKQTAALLPLLPAALRLEVPVLQRLQKLGLYRIGSFIHMPRTVLRRRFGEDLLLKLGQALGREPETILPLQVIPPYQERLPCMEPIRTAAGIQIAIRKLLEKLCRRLEKENKGLRSAVLASYRVDGRVLRTEIGTSAPSHHNEHLFKLFELKITGIEPGLGIELFVLEALKTEELSVIQKAIWLDGQGLYHREISELLDRVAAKVGNQAIHRYLPDEHFWPERSIKAAANLLEKPSASWHNSRPRPTQLLPVPERIEVSAPIPDYPPMLFIYKGKQHHIKKADGPERIEREWWLEKGEHRDYYYVEDEAGARYWLFRSGHYSAGQSSWFIHGFFA